ncbi:MAG: GC-type dockerin domain-anchored protein [Planctomycetota bacterium]
MRSISLWLVLVACPVVIKPVAVAGDTEAQTSSPPPVEIVVLEFLQSYGSRISINHDGRRVSGQAVSIDEFYRYDSFPAVWEISDSLTSIHPLAIGPASTDLLELKYLVGMSDDGAVFAASDSAGCVADEAEFELASRALRLSTTQPAIVLEPCVDPTTESWASTISGNGKVIGGVTRPVWKIGDELNGANGNQPTLWNVEAADRTILPTLGPPLDHGYVSLLSHDGSIVIGLLGDWLDAALVRWIDGEPEVIPSPGFAEVWGSPAATPDCSSMVISGRLSGQAFGAARWSGSASDGEFEVIGTSADPGPSLYLAIDANDTLTTMIGTGIFPTGWEGLRRARDSVWTEEKGAIPLDTIMRSIDLPETMSSGSWHSMAISGDGRSIVVRNGSQDLSLLLRFGGQLHMYYEPYEIQPSAQCYIADFAGERGSEQAGWIVDLEDLSGFVSTWLSNRYHADITTTGATFGGQPGFGEHDGVIDLDDLAFFIRAWMSCQ